MPSALNTDAWHDLVEKDPEFLEKLEKERKLAERLGAHMIWKDGAMLRELLARGMIHQDVALRDKITKNIYSGKGFEGRQVRVFGGDEDRRTASHVRFTGSTAVFVGSYFKGQRGEVIGSSVAQQTPVKNAKEWKPPAEEADKVLRGNRAIWKGAIMHVQFEGAIRGQVARVAIEHLEDIK